MNSDDSPKFDVPSDSASSMETVALSAASPKPSSGRSGSGSLPPLDAGSDFAGYQIIRKIAQGAMGVVYLAQDLTLQRKLAIKVILTSPGMQATEEQVNRFLREARSIAQLRHKRIVPVYEVGTFENCQYFTMEYIEGPTLEQYMLNHEITAAKAIEIVLAIAEGLQEAHAKHIVHRDIKPANIIMQNSQNPMITDFGLAKILEQEPKLTMTGSMLGTPCYMSPEQARGDSDLDQRSDIFSLGVLLYEMVTEKLPFKGESYMKTVLKVIEGTYIMPRKIKPRLSRDVESIIRKALENDRDFRYQGINEFIDDCLRFQRGEVVLISRSELYRKVFRHIAKHRNSIIMSVMIVLIIGYLAMRNIDQSQAVNNQLQDTLRVSREKEETSRENERISKEKKQLELQGELLKRGTTTPEFIERFDNEKYFLDHWLTSWSPVTIQKGVLNVPKAQNVILTPKQDSFSPSALFSCKAKIAAGNSLAFFFGSTDTSTANAIDKLMIALFSVEQESNGDAFKKGAFKLKISFYQLQNKKILNRIKFDLAELLKGETPIAVKSFVLPNTLPESLYFGVKRHEFYYEFSVKEKENLLMEEEESYHKEFRVSSVNYFNTAPLTCGLYIPQGNFSSLEIEKFRVDRWIVGSSEIEINRIVENNWRPNNSKVLLSALQKYQDQVELMLYAVENTDEIATLKYQVAKTAFFKGIIAYRSLIGQGSKEDVASIAENYRKALELTSEYIGSSLPSKKTEFINYEELYLATLTQLIFFNVFIEDYTQANDFLNIYQNYTNDYTPYRNWMWNLTDPLEKWAARVRTAPQAKWSEKLNALMAFLNHLDFTAEADNLTNFGALFKDLLNNIIEIPDFSLFEKYHELTKDETDQILLRNAITKESAKDKISSLYVLNVLKLYARVFKLSEVQVIGNYYYVNKLVRYSAQKDEIWRDYSLRLEESPLLQKVFQRYPRFQSVFEQSKTQGVKAFNPLIEDSNFRHALLVTLQDDLYRINRKEIKKDLLGLNEVFPINVEIDQNRGGNISISVENNGIKIRLITKDNELKNSLPDAQVNQGDCWDLFFDFRQGNAFMSRMSNLGSFRISYVPTANDTAVRIVPAADSVAPKFEVLNYNNNNRNIQQNEIVLFLPLSEIYKLTGGTDLSYFGFNAMLNLESGGKNELRVLFPDREKKILLLSNQTLSAPDSLLTDKELSNELMHIYALNESVYQDKIMVKKVIDHWLGLLPSQPLWANIQFEKVRENLLNIISEDSKQIRVKRIIENVELYFSVIDVFDDLENNDLNHTKIRYTVVKNLLACLKNNLGALERKSTAPQLLKESAFLEEIKRARAFLTYADGEGRKYYYRFLEQCLGFYKNTQSDLYNEYCDFLMQLPDAAANYREKTIAFMLQGRLSEALFYLNKHLESEYWRDDERAWFEYQILGRLANSVGIDIKLSDEISRDRAAYFAGLENSIELDTAAVLDRKMKLQEFIAKYPNAEKSQNLITLLLNDVSGPRKAEEIKDEYQKYLKKENSSWLTAMINRRLSQLP